MGASYGFYSLIPILTNGIYYLWVIEEDQSILQHVRF